MRWLKALNTESVCCIVHIQRLCCYYSVSQSCPTLCEPMNYSTPGFPILHHLLEFAETHIHWVSDAIQQSHPLSSPSPPAFNLSQHQSFSNELALHIRWPKYWSFSLSISLSNEYSKAAAAAASAKSLQSCLTLCGPIDGCPLGSSVPGILQARILEWVAVSFSSAWKWKVKVKSLSCAWLLGTPWTGAYQAPPPMGFARQDYWSGGAIAFSNSKASYMY